MAQGRGYDVCDNDAILRHRARPASRKPFGLNLGPDAEASRPACSDHTPQINTFTQALKTATAAWGSFEFNRRRPEEPGFWRRRRRPRRRGLAASWSNAATPSGDRNYVVNNDIYLKGADSLKKPSGQLLSDASVHLQRMRLGNR